MRGCLVEVYRIIGMWEGWEDAWARMLFFGMMRDEGRSVMGYNAMEKIGGNVKMMVMIFWIGIGHFCANVILRTQLLIL